MVCRPPSTSRVTCTLSPSMTSLEARMSPKTSALDLISILSLAVTLPLILPRTTTEFTLRLPLTAPVSPRWRRPSELISPSSLPSMVNSPENLRLPLISTSELKTFFAELGVLFIITCSTNFLSKSLLSDCGGGVNRFVGGDRVPPPHGGGYGNGQAYAEIR